MKWYINVNKHTIAKNNKLPPGAHKEPPIRVSKGKHGKPKYFHAFPLGEQARIVYAPDDPLPCGAKVYIVLDEAR